MLEIWHPANYEHVDLLEEKEIIKSPSGLIIKVGDDRKIFSFIYDQQGRSGNFVEAFRFMDEMKAGYLFQEASAARRRYFGDDRHPWYLYKSTRSDFIHWYDQLPGPGTDLYPVEHHVISTVESTFEILSTYEPKVIVENIIK